MSPRSVTASNESKILPGDHEAMTPGQRRTHYGAGCRHELCRAAANEYQREYAQRKRTGATTRATAAAPTADPPAPDAQTASPTPPKPTAPPPTTTGHTPARGATRRLQGLVFAGHSPVSIASATRISVDEIWWLLLGQHTTIPDLVHRVIDREFKRLRTMTPEPRAATAAERNELTARCKTLAAEHGWAGPFAWEWIDTDDEPKYATTAGAGTGLPKKTTAPATPPVAVEEPDPTPEPLEVAYAPEPAKPSATALAAVRQLRALANAAEAAAEALEGGL